VNEFTGYGCAKEMLTESEQGDCDS
jgi:hypothetical protein